MGDHNADAAGVDRDLNDPIAKFTAPSKSIAILDQIRAIARRTLDLEIKRVESNIKPLYPAPVLAEIAFIINEKEANPKKLLDASISLDIEQALRSAVSAIASGNLSNIEKEVIYLVERYPPREKSSEQDSVS